MIHKARILKHLSQESRKGKGTTVASLSKHTGVPKISIYRRVRDLREDGYSIHTSVKLVNGKRKSYYRLAG